MFLLDEVCAADGLRTRLFLRQFLERYFNPHDIGAVLLAGRGLVRDGQTFTGNKRLLLTAIEKQKRQISWNTATRVKWGDQYPNAYDIDLTVIIPKE